MQARRLTATLFVLAILSVHLPAATKGKPPATANVPAGVTFRCPGAGCPSTDRVAGDLFGPYEGDVDRYYFNTDGGHGALWLWLPPERSFTLDFTQTDGPAPCVLTSLGCRMEFVIVEVPGATVAVNPTDESDVALPEGFESIPIGGSAYARVKINFADPLGREFEWSLRFNSGAYAGSTNVAVSRLDENTWEVEATADDRARLVSYTTRGKHVTTDEGLFVMPFKMTVTK